MTVARPRIALAAALGAAALLAGALPAPAQPEVVDRVVAVVGNEIVLLSEVDEEIYLAHLRGRIDIDDVEAVDAYRSEVLQALVEAKILLAEARRDGLRVTRDEVDAAVQGMIADVRSRFPDEETFLAQLEREGTSMEELRTGYRGKVEEQLLVRQLVNRRVRSRVTVDERDVRAYWEENKDDLPRVPARLDLSRILVSLRASAAVDSAAVQRAQLVRRRLLDGEEFATLARVFSEGPAADRGGEIGWLDPADLDPALAAAVDVLEPGQVSDVVVSARGAHVLRVDARDDGGRVRLRQIVFLRDEEAARARARARAEEVLRRLQAGEDFAAVAEEVSDDPVSAPRGGRLGEVPLESLDPRYRTALDRLEPGSLSGLVEDEDGFSVFRVEGREGERDATFDDVRERLASLLQQREGQKYYEELLKKARARTFVELRLDGADSPVTSPDGEGG